LRFVILYSVTCILTSFAYAQWEPEVQLTYAGNPARIWANNGWFLAATAGGALQAVWWEGRDGNPEVYGKRSTDNGATWLADQDLSNDPDTSWCPSLAVSDSALHLVYKDKSAGWGAFYRRSTDGGATWSADTALARFSSPIGGSMTCAASDSLVHVLWAVFHGEHTQVSYRRSPDRGITWQSEVLLTHDSARSEDPSAAVSESAVHVVWFDTRNSAGDVYYERSLDDGATWGPETRLTSDSAIAYAATVAAADSLVHVAWIDRRSGSYHFQTYYMRSTDWGTTWEPEVRLADNPGSCMFPVLAASGRNVHIAWYDNRTGNNQLYYRNSTNGGLDWTPEFRLTQTSTNSSNPAIALSGDAIHVIFCDDRSGDTELYYLRNPTGNAGTEENLKPQAPSHKPAATIVRGVLVLGAVGSRQKTAYRAELLDAAGRKVMGLRAGANDVSHLSLGVHFWREQPKLDRLAQTAHEVVVIR
jgi:hypothetical protein